MTRCLLCVPGPQILTMRFLASVVSLLLLAVATTVSAAPTEAEIKKMKIKDLKSFLDARGLNCKGCQEKSDFVAMALENINTPVGSGSKASSSGSSSPPPPKREVPAGDFWDVWSNIAREQCTNAATKENIDAAEAKTTCSSIATAIDSIYMRQGKRTATQLKKKPDALLKTSFLDVYYQAGKRNIARIIGYCFKNKATCASASKLQTVLEQDNKIKNVALTMFLTNVGVENTNPMYDILKEKNVAHDEL